MEEKIKVKELGPDKLKLIIKQQTQENIKFTTGAFAGVGSTTSHGWLAVGNALFCFPWILFKKGYHKFNLSWKQSGITDIKHLSEHLINMNNRVHIENCQASCAKKD